MRFFITLIVLPILIFGCSKSPSSEFEPGMGDPGAFVLAQVLKRNGRPIATKDLPKIGGQWSYFEDENGVIIYLEKSRFRAIQGFLIQCLGEPAHAPSETTTGGKLGWYASQTIGAAVQFGYDKDMSFINIIRPMSSDELIERFERIAEEHCP